MSPMERAVWAHERALHYRVREADAHRQREALLRDAGFHGSTEPLVRAVQSACAAYARRMGALAALAFRIEARCQRRAQARAAGIMPEASEQPSKARRAPHTRGRAG